MIDSANARYRPAFHLSPPLGWMNDPVGFTSWNGAWHLFYQHYPHAPRWGAMHWGHARSTDLIQWEHLPIALYPDLPDYQGGCFSGSAIPTPDGQLMLMYTNVIPGDSGVRQQVQCIALSDDGITFEKYAGNPVIDQTHIPPLSSSLDFRDPKMVSHNGKTYALIASHDNTGHGQILLYQSDNLMQWTFKSVLLPWRFSSTRVSMP